MNEHQLITPRRNFLIRALGFTAAFLPAGNAADAAGFPEIDARPVSRVADFVREIWGRG